MACNLRKYIAKLNPNWQLSKYLKILFNFKNNCMQLYIVDCKEDLEPNYDENVDFAICPKISSKVFKYNLKR